MALVGLMQSNDSLKAFWMNAAFSGGLAWLNESPPTSTLGAMPTWEGDSPSDDVRRMLSEIDQSLTELTGLLERYTKFPERLAGPNLSEPGLGGQKRDWVLTFETVMSEESPTSRDRRTSARAHSEKTMIDLERHRRYFVSAEAWCDEQAELQGELKKWATAQRKKIEDATVPKDDCSTPITEAIVTGVQLLGSTPRDRFLVISGDAEPYYSDRWACANYERGVLPAGILTDIFVVIGPFQASEQRGVHFEEEIRAYLAPADPLCVEFVSAIDEDEEVGNRIQSFASDHQCDCPAEKS